ncbi:MAG: sulfite exporter TauE/SafE family protein, partial [Leptospiraceae bacterium]|nr:sulfite exporter TauE/SafE family protein [Leptospiraceae bacterium]
MLDELTVLIETWAGSSLAVPYIAVPVYMLAGLLSSAFPCVYPLIPITVGFIQNRTQPEESRWKHPLLYWLGTILAYTLLGLIAAAGGGAFNTLMQNGIVILGTAFLFLFLAAVTVDWFPLTWGTGDRLMHRAAGHSGMLFTVLMGLAAGFVASACVAPALVTMLLFIAKNAATDGGLSLGGILYGGLLSLSFGVGIGVPFFAAGVAGTRLPKSGGWMSLIKHSFAILIFLFALYQMFKGFSVLGWDAMDIYL